MNKEITFTQSWVESIVRKALNKTEGAIYQNDIEKIKYLRIGETFDNDFFIEISIAEPPMPFVDTDGGEEWTYACIGNEDISRFIEERGEEIQLYTFKFKFENSELREYAWSETASEKWNKYETSVFENNFYKEIEDEDEWEAWYDAIRKDLAQELMLFTGVKVLRIKGLEFHDYKFLEQFSKLQVLEVVETRFCNPAGIEELKRLKQLCCWLG